MSPESLIRVALTGFGSVGQAFAKILIEYPDLPIIITAVADRGGYAVSPGGLAPDTLLNAKRSGSIARHENGTAATFQGDQLRESGAEVLVELASTNYEDGEPGWSYVKSAFGLGLDVVLASKGPLVAHWDDLFETAGREGARVGFSATHGAPLPAIDLVRFGLAGSRLLSVRALFNSTTGLLLEQMETGRSLEQALLVATEAGVVETNPALDVEGWDAAAKCVIVGRSLFGGRIRLEDVDRQGIDNLTADEVQEAAREGRPIKLLCTIESTSDGAKASVRPTRLLAGDPLATLRDGALGIVYDCEPMGPVFLAAYGSGGTPTAAAVIRDILNLRRQVHVES